MPNPFDDPELYRSVIIDNRASPGVVTITGHDRKTTWDVKNAKGQKGATITLKEQPPAEFTLTFSLVRDDAQGINDWAEWDDYVRLFRDTVDGSTAKAKDIYHPDLAENGIASFAKAKIGGRVHDGKGGQTVVIVCQEYWPPQKKPGGVGASPRGAKTKVDPDAAAKAELARLTQAYQDAGPWL